MPWIRLLALLLATCAANSAAPNESGEPGPGQIGFPWFIVPETTDATRVMPDLNRIRLRDMIREASKEQLYWDNFRATEERRIRDRYRIETQIAMQQALAAADARKAFAKKKSSRSVGSSPPADSIATEPAYPRTGTGEKSAVERKQTRTLGDRVDKLMDAARREAMNAVQKIDRAVDRIMITSPTGPTSAASRGLTFFLLLLALFLIPAIAISLLLLALIHMRRGDHLQSVLFGLLGCTMLVLLAFARA